MESLFGARVGGITDWVSSLSGISRSSSSSLLGLALPLVLGQIGKRVMGSGGGVSSLMNLLGEQRQFLQDAPAGLASVLGDAGTRQVGTYESESRHPVPVGAYPAAPRRSASWLWLLLLALIPVLLFMLSRRNTEPARKP